MLGVHKLLGGGQVGRRGRAAHHASQVPATFATRQLASTVSLTTISFLSAGGLRTYSGSIDPPLKSAAGKRLPDIHDPTDEFREDRFDSISNFRYM
jgi:hypothetical protein